MPEIVLIAKTQYNELRQRLINIDERLEELMGGAKAPKREIPNAPDDADVEQGALKDKVVVGSPGDKISKMKNALKGK